MAQKIVAGAAATPLAALVLAACVSRGFRATHPVAPNDAPQGRAQSLRIKMVLGGTGG